MKLSQISIILVRPQLPENIGMVARGMGNFGLKKLIIVSPREKWPNKKSLEASKQSSSIIKNAKIYDKLEKAIKKFNLIIATTSRKRFLEKKTLCDFSQLKDLKFNNSRIGILFGPENSGLSNNDIRLADYLFKISTDKKNNSLNLSHAVTIFSFKLRELFFGLKNNDNFSEKNYSEKVNKLELSKYMNFLIEKLERVDFFNPAEKKESMIDNLYALYSKSSLTKKELNTLWGVLKKLKK